MRETLILGLQEAQRDRRFCLPTPKRAFYAFPNIEKFGMSSDAFAEFLLKEAKVMTVPGSAYGTHGEGHIRISYETAYEKLEEALDRIEKAVRKLQ